MAGAARRAALGTAAVVAAGIGVFAVANADPSAGPPPTTPIKHVVVLFGENESFDHYFGTYPTAANPPGQPRFDAAPGTPAVNGLSPALLTANPNSANPARLDRSQAVTCDQKHGYGDEQKAANGGLMNKFVEFTGGGSCAPPRGASIVMDYYDGNTVTALWNLANHFALNDTSFGTTYGPSTPGAVNLVSGNTHGVSPLASGENGTMIGDPQPGLDDCSAAGAATTLSGVNVGDLMNAKGVTWGWFQGGFKPTATSGGRAVCGSQHANAANGVVGDYIPHHEPFQYYASTANPHHLPPSSVASIGSTDQANHQYDLTDFDAALAAGNLPQVSFLKAAAFEDAHPGYSGPLDEQRFIARTLNALQQSPEWASTAVFLAYDDSDGWYDHVMAPIVSPSTAPSDALTGPGQCGGAPAPGAYLDRCGYGPRLPLLVVSPYARQNFVDHTLTDQTSVLRFIEDNWTLGRIGDQSFDERAGSVGGMFDFNQAAAPKLFLSPDTGVVLPGPPPPATTATPAATAAPAATATPKPAPAPTPVKVKTVAIKLSCAVKRAGKHVTVSCTATGKDVGKAKTAVRFRLVRGRSTILATRSTTLSHKRAKVVLRLKKTPKAGRYTLRITITQPGALTALTRTVRLR